MHIFSNILQNQLFHDKHEVIELGFTIKYMCFPSTVQIRPLMIQTHKINNKKQSIKEIHMGVTTNSFVFANIYKSKIEANISRYYFSKYQICIIFVPLSH